MFFLGRLVLCFQHVSVLANCTGKYTLDDTEEVWKN
jgi:hypothetical protein